MLCAESAGFIERFSLESKRVIRFRSRRSSAGSNAVGKRTWSVRRSFLAIGDGVRSGFDDAASLVSEVIAGDWRFSESVLRRFVRNCLGVGKVFDSIMLDGMRKSSNLDRNSHARCRFTSCHPSSFYASVNSYSIETACFDNVMSKLMDVREVVLEDLLLYVESHDTICMGLMGITSV